MCRNLVIGNTIATNIGELKALIKCVHIHDAYDFDIPDGSCLCPVDWEKTASGSGYDADYSDPFDIIFTEKAHAPSPA